MTIKLYTTHCPKCKVLESKLAQKNITYTEVTDTDVMFSKGYTFVPVLEIDDKILNFKEANEWINNYKN